MLSLRTLLLIPALAACGSTAAVHASAPGDACAAQAGDDPAAMSLCLAHHHKVLSSTDTRLRGCLDHAQGGRAVVNCMSAAAR